MTLLNVYLFKRKPDDLRSYITEDYRSRSVSLRISGCDQVIFSFKEPEDTAPQWYDFLSSHIAKESLPQSLTSPSAVLIVEVNNSIFALTFGPAGRYMVELSHIVNDFGLKVCLNNIASDKIKTVDKRSLEQLSIHTKQQASSPVDFNAFEIEIDRDLIKSVEGHLENSFAKYLKGSSSLTIRTEKPLEKIATLCSELLTNYRKKTYQADFGWIDNVKLITDDQITLPLENLLMNKLKNSDFTELFLGAPEIIDDAKVDSYSFSGQRGNFVNTFPSIESYFSFFKTKKEQEEAKGSTLDLSLEILKSHRLKAYEHEATKPGKSLKRNEVYSWTVFECLNGEVISKGKTYKLLEGNWYEIEQKYLQGIETTINSIVHSNLPLPAMGFTEKEGAYNVRASAALKAACMDQQFIKIAGRSKFEFCDIFTNDKHLIHVKKHTGASSISHLLYQGHVSGMLFSQEPNIRTEISNHGVIAYHKMAGKVRPVVFKASDYKVIFAIAVKQKKPLSKILTFFSKISLAHKYKSLTARGYQVEVQIIPMK
ncbi:hypothetical protein DOM22_06590 [Bdellovibrio sp. ZAP7]|uniref:DUF6119 family protein n=1 Tax=Bdellovibrio sp. ZAP7 TaxID=2231053 RepID=UPI00115C1233|nr:DUF6119 family protein [Bdellovibrio sp. ZAP7]QDK44851.1 hypothetical protein DOM22_06590 [Bdellovibrio sp. ZAP7]